MTTAPPSTLRLRPDQAEALASPARLEIIEALGMLEPCAIGDLATHLQRSFGSVFHHVRTLVAARLVTEVGQRPGPRRPEILYAVAAPRLRVAGTTRGPSGTAALRTLQAMLRQAGRDARDCLAQPAGRSTRRLVAAQLSGPLLPAEVRQIQRHLDQIDALLRHANRRRSRRGALYRWTTVFAPLHRTKGDTR